MEKMAGRARRMFLQTHPANSPSAHSGQLIYQNRGATTSYSPAQSPLNQLPESFSDVHPYLARYVEQIKFTAAPVPQDYQYHTTGQRGLQSRPQAGAPDPRTAGESWMPDIYQYASVGVSVEERYGARAQAQPTPFVPSSPRVDENETFNFDHGALMVDLEDTSYMAWF